MVANPLSESRSVTVENQPRDLDPTDRVSHGDAAGKRRPVPPLDEEGERGVTGCLLDPGAPPLQQSAVGRRPRAGTDAQAEPSSKIVELASPHRPTEWPAERGTHPGSPAPEHAARSLGLVDDGDQLEVRLAERYDPVGRAPARVTAALDRREAVPRFDLLGSRRQIGYRDQYVVELQTMSVLRGRDVR